MTVVEWLQEALESTILTHEQIMQTIGLFEQAKEMEKQQIIDAYEEGTYHNTFGNEDYETSEQYYNETFKK